MLALTLPCLALLVPASQAALNVDFSSPASIKTAASSIAFNMMTYYTGNQSGQTPGLLPGSGTPTGYYWWEGGAMFGTLVNYWYLTGDTTYNAVTTQALQFQVGADKDYEPANATLSLGNDDQAFWGMSALMAAEYRYPNPPSDKPQWLALAQAVWNRQQARWDTQYCAGGLRWQIFNFNAGYDYKNSISNGCFFNMGARLGKYTGNQTYLDWAEKTWDWMVRVNLIDNNYNVFDGTGVEQNCTQVDHLQWSYNVGVVLYGAACMWNATQSQTWRDRTAGLIKAAKVFTNNTIMQEVACETIGTCNTDQKSFKAYLSRFLAATAEVASWSTTDVFDILAPSAKGAAESCNLGANGATCGLQWTTGSFDGSTGVGQEMSALEVIQNMLLRAQPGIVPGPVNTTGGISQGDPSAGTGGQSTNLALVDTTPATTADKAGAAIVTILVGGIVIAGALWMSL